MKKNYLWVILVLFLLACNNSDDSLFTERNLDTTGDENTSSENSEIVKLLSLGDSYTIGQSVCTTCRFPAQLKDSLAQRLDRDVSVDIIAQTGWTTTNLQEAITNANPETDYDLVTLLIGVNNQYQGQPFSLYELEFPSLVTQAIALAKEDPNRVVVISIPDYAYTLFGQSSGNQEITSTEIDTYNLYAENYCNAIGIQFLNITDITREGLENPELVASDNLHPSELAYTRFVERLLPLAIEKID